MQEKNLLQNEVVFTALFRAVVALLVSALLLVGSYAAMHRGDVEVKADDKIIQGAQLSRVMGRVKADGESIVITEFQQVGDEWHAMVSLRGSFWAEKFELLSYQFRGHFPSLRANFFWIGASDPEQIYKIPLPIKSGPSSTTSLSYHPHWRGKIAEVGVHFIGEPRNEQLVLDHLTLQAGGAYQALAALKSEWFSYKGWAQTSINHLYGTTNKATTSPTASMAAWAGLSALVLLGVGLFTHKHYAASYGAVVLIPWIALDLLWQAQLSTQLTETSHQFRGKSMHEKHLADIDAGIYSYVNRLKEETLPAYPARIFILHNSIGHNFDRLKTQYYLLPHNVYNFGNTWQSKHLGSLRPGDYVLVLGEVPGFPSGAGISKLKWNTQGLRAVFEDGDARGRLYRISADLDSHLEESGLKDTPHD